jgi:predicted MPP superfamily phosphohydrolase
MPTSSFSWLHLTDFHYGLKGQDCLWPTLREPFLDSLAGLHERCGPWDAVLFTGDLVQSGETAQFETMQAEVLDPLWKRLGELGSGDAVLLAVPGNHDLYRPNPKEDNAAIDVLLEKDGFQRIEAKFWDQPAGGYRRVINDAFAAYSQWWNKAPYRPGDVKAGILPGDFSVTLQHGGRRIGIVGLNTTFPTGGRRLRGASGLECPAASRGL